MVLIKFKCETIRAEALALLKTINKSFKLFIRRRANEGDTKQIGEFRREPS